MSISNTNVCRCLLKDNFGDLAETIGSLLLLKGACHLRQIAAETNIGLDKVRKVLTVLIQHNLVSFVKSKRGLTEYFLETDAVLWRNRIPRYIHCAKSLYGDAAELVIEDVLHHGQVTMMSVVNSVTNKLNEALENAGHPKIERSVVYDKFKCLASTHFIKQCPNPVETLGVVQDEREMSRLYVVPPLAQQSETDRKRKMSLDEDNQPEAKRRKTDQTKPTDDGTYWKINYQRFHQFFRDQLLVKAITKKIDKRAGDILQTMLRLCEVKSDDMAFTTNPLSFTEIFQAVPRELGITRHLCEQYLSMLADDSTGFVMKTGESGGGMFVVNIFLNDTEACLWSYCGEKLEYPEKPLQTDIMKALTTLCTAHIESVVQERFGSKSLRIFRVLLLKKHLEQKQIEEMAMIPTKEAKELLYNMFAEGFVTITEIAKTPDHAPARTYYLFRVNIQQLARLLLDHSLKALSNAVLKREAETRENRRLMEKQERVDAIIANLEQSGSDDVQKEEILETITPAEKTQLAKVKHMINMLEQSELQLDETIFMLETYLLYHDEKLRQKL